MHSKLEVAKRRESKRTLFRLARITEFSALFVLIPFLYYLRLFPIRVLLFLWILGGITALYLWRHPKVKMRDLLRWDVPKEKLNFVLKRFAILAVLAALAVYLIAPDHFMDFPIHRTQVWLVVLIFYPIFSVIPQSLIYRIFFERRYRVLFSKPWYFVIGGAITFSFMHLIYENWVAILMTFVGGIFFLKTYLDSRSFLLSCLEHALYGCLMFTIGLGRFFYLGSGS